MIYTLVVTATPVSGQSANTAAKFALALVGAGHSICRVFFLDDGVYAGSDCSVSPQDEADRLAPWVDLNQQHGVELVLCTSSALRRGMLDVGEAERYEKNAATVHPAFIISGLGQLVDAATRSDRLLTFGG